ncbi:T9SS type A sorting domain-containing protein [Dyadobacter subterraneus]|uniref:T9SS type A sorting domain-containing protein n=1 Tax=Dyadobacter subterraneus TaxID=2773304 RepID=A0ABR9W984_9BACT|nr:T9SS type A sorting domain-containing protein [Dyadobacter subterraneus]MBE9462028.1 T9SS type A sorting domain-containing protein [Dyadobacter subterraneus]
MNFKSLLSIVFFIGFQFVRAQGTDTPTIQISGIEAVCTHKEMKIPGHFTGSFNENNRFAVEFVEAATRRVIASYPAVYETGYFLFTINNDNLATITSIDFRISASSPTVTSNVAYGYRFYNRGSISMTMPGQVGDTLNPGSRITAMFSTTSNVPVSVTMNDSSRFEVPARSYIYQNYSASAKGEIFIVKAENGCGVQVPSPEKITYKLNPISIIPLKINNTAVCAGREIEISYATNSGAIPASAKFRLRFQQLNKENIVGYPNFELVATRKSDGILVATIPESVTQNADLIYRMAIIVESPNLVSPFLGYTTIYRKPVATITSQSKTISMGDEFGLAFSVSGPGPFALELSNGDVAYSQYSDYIYTNVKPLKTETYSIKSLKSACGTTTDVPKQSVTATVEPGIYLPITENNRFDNRTFYKCENQKVRLPFQSNVTLPAETKFIIEGITQNDKVYQFDAKIVGDSIEFFIPASPKEWVEEGYFSIKKFRAKSMNPTYSSKEVYGFPIYGIPRVKYNFYMPTTLPYAQKYTYDVRITGGDTFWISDQNDNEDWGGNDMVMDIFVDKTGNYQPKSIRNVCYNAESIPPVNLTVENYTSIAPVITVIPSSDKRVICDNGDVEVYFETLGQFADNNEFKIYLTDNPNAPLLTVKKPGRYKLLLTDKQASEFHRIGVISTSPVVRDESTVLVYREVKPYLVTDGNNANSAENPYLVNSYDRPNADLWGIKSNSFYQYVPITVNFSGGGKNYSFTRLDLSQNNYIDPPKSVVTPYTLKSATNICGTTEFNNTAYVLWKGYEINLIDFVNTRSFCVGEEMIARFGVTGGIPPSGTKFNLQLSKANGNFQTISSVEYTAGEFRVRIPELATGNYEVRVISDDRNYSRSYNLRIIAKPTGTIALGKDSPNPAEGIPAGSYVTLVYNLTGGEPYVVSTTGFSETEVNSSSYEEGYQFVRSGVYQIESVRNQCGYGTFSGSVAAKVTPLVKRMTAETNTRCIGGSITATYSVEGDLESAQKIGFYLSAANNQKVDLSFVSNKSGSVNLPIPSNLAPGAYVLTCYITGVKEVANSEPIYLDKAPALEIIGTTTINAGETTNIEVRPKEIGGKPVTLTLSNGASQELYFSELRSNYITVSPDATTTYTIKTVESFCGPVPFSGSATVIVNPASVRSVKINSVVGSRAYVTCEADTVQVYFTKTGTFTAGNRFVAKLYDNQGKVIEGIVSIGQESPLKVIVPTGLAASNTYRFRVVATDANTSSSDNAWPIVFSAKPTASFLSNTVTADKDGMAKIVVKLEGTGSWTYTYSNDLGSHQKSSLTPADTLYLSNVNIQTYKLLSVSNVCGAGKIVEPSSVSVALILGFENTLTEEIKIGPNPVQSQLRVQFVSVAKRSIKLYTSAGTQIQQFASYGKEAVVDFSGYASSIYLLKIEEKGMTKVIRVVKL